MDSTLTALLAAIIDKPADLTVRLVYADALDESDDPANAARAEFIRAQAALETLPTDDPSRPAIAGQCRALFAANWIDWWRPVCEAVGLPEPYVPRQGLGARVKRLPTSDKREIGSPYLALVDAWSIQSREHGFTAQFIAGFPERLTIDSFTIDTYTGQFHDWFIRAPFHRLRLSGNLSEFEWESLDGPHLAKLTELVVDQLTAEVANRLVLSPLKGLTTLKVGPSHPAESVVRSLIRNPQWSRLQSLTLLGTCSPGAIQTLATDCRLTELEELSIGVSEVPEFVPVTGLFGVLGAMIGEIHARFLATYPTPPGPIAGPDYWPVLEALARSPLFRQLRRFTITDAEPGWLDRIANMLQIADATEVEVPPFLSDECVRTLAAGLNADKLERLELPRTRLSPESRTELTARFGSRLVLA
jgi:uncharacterized protein (TIGR02996 family)